MHEPISAKLLQRLDIQGFDNIDPTTGSSDKERRGQVLVVSTVANDDTEQSCIVGMVDARANKNANVLAREIADDIAPTFHCGSGKAIYHGAVGPLAGSPAF